MTLYSTAQIAQQLSVTQQTVNTWIRTGKLKATKIGKAYLDLWGNSVRRLAGEATHR